MEERRESRKLALRIAQMLAMIPDTKVDHVLAQARAIRFGRDRHFLSNSELLPNGRNRTYNKQWRERQK